MRVIRHQKPKVLFFFKMMLLVLQVGEISGEIWPLFRNNV